MPGPCLRCVLLWAYVLVERHEALCLADTRSCDQLFCCVNPLALPLPCALTHCPADAGSQKGDQMRYEYIMMLVSSDLRRAPLLFWPSVVDFFPTRYNASQQIARVTRCEAYEQHIKAHYLCDVVVNVV